MNLRVLLPIFCLFGLFVGLLMMLSPLFVTGGYVGWQNNVRSGDVQNFIDIAFSVVMSVVMGIAVMIGSGICAVVLGVTFGIEAGSKRNSQPPVHRQRSASGPEVSPKSEEVDNHGLIEHVKNDEPSGEPEPPVTRV